MKVRPATPADAAAIAAVYAPYVKDTPVSFETEPPGDTEIAKRMASGGDLYGWLVAEEDGALAGFASASQFRPRAAYRFTVEVSVYLAAGFHGRGLGGSLYGRLLDLVERQGFAQAIAAITLPNEASVKLHEGLGFKPCGLYRDVGWKFGRWHSVGLWQRALGTAGIPTAEPRPYAEVWNA